MKESTKETLIIGSIVAAGLVLFIGMTISLWKEHWVLCVLWICGGIWAVWPVLPQNKS